MTLSEFKKALSEMEQLQFTDALGQLVPAHFHITEVGLNTRHFIDCGGVERVDRYVTFQLWIANDLQHRLDPEKLLHIVEMSNPLLLGGDWPIEVEYQNETIGRYDLAQIAAGFQLVSKQTNCLAPDRCGVPNVKPKIAISEIGKGNTTCKPGGNCC